MKDQSQMSEQIIRFLSVKVLQIAKTLFLANLRVNVCTSAISSCLWGQLLIIYSKSKQSQCILPLFQLLAREQREKFYVQCRSFCDAKLEILLFMFLSASKQHSHELWLLNVRGGRREEGVLRGFQLTLSGGRLFVEKYKRKTYIL